MRKNVVKLFSICMIAALTLSPMQYVSAAEVVGTIRINEVNSAPDDWVEIINLGTGTMDLSGYEIRDNSDDHRWQFAKGSSIKAGDLMVVEATTVGKVYNDETNTYVEGTFESAIGIGSGDSIRIYDREGNVIDECAWTEHASYEGDAALASIGRYPDGTGSFVIMKETKGLANDWYKPQVVINEVESKEAAGGDDWIELANPTNEDIDVSDIVIKDNDDEHIYTIPEGTLISANGFLVINETELGFGLGGEDSVRLYEGEMLIGTTSWSSHAACTWGLYPDVNGTEYRNTKEATPGAINKFADAPELINWPGKEDVTVYDQEAMFLEDSSGLDFYNGQLYAVDNGTGKFWILDVAEDGSLTFAKGFENGKRVRFQKDAENPTAAGPDTEGISVDGNGMVYLASERDNSAKGVNYNSILMVNPKAEGEDLIALKEWDLTASLPQVSANMGIEAVEWIDSKNVNGKLFDQNTNEAFDIANYPNATANGVFFVALEDNGHVYAYVLNSDGTSVQIADIDSKIGGAMALDYDTYENVLWVVSDNGYNNRAAEITFNGTNEATIKHVNAPAGLDVTANNEGFAIAEYTYTKDGQRPVYRFLDGVTSGALSIGKLNCDYVADDTSDDTTPEDGKDNVTDNTTPEDGKDNPSNDITIKEDNDKKPTESPKTGDYTPVFSYMICVGVSIIVILGIFFRKKFSR